MIWLTAPLGQTIAYMQADAAGATLTNADQRQVDWRFTTSNAASNSGAYTQAFRSDNPLVNGRRNGAGPAWRVLCNELGGALCPC